MAYVISIVCYGIYFPVSHVVVLLHFIIRFIGSFIVRIYELFIHISVLHVYIIRRMKYYVNRRLKKYLYRIMQILKLYRFLL